MKCCPKCKCRILLATATVAQVWSFIDDYYIETTDDYKETLHCPDDSDLWTCSACGFHAPGEEFNNKESR